MLQKDEQCTQLQFSNNLLSLFWLFNRVIIGKRQVQYMTYTNSRRSQKEIIISPCFEIVLLLKVSRSRNKIFEPISSFKYFRVIRIEKQIRLFVFLGEVMARQFCFDIYWPLNEKLFLAAVWIGLTVFWHFFRCLTTLKSPFPVKNAL